MGCYAMGSFYHLCQTITTEEIVDGFTAVYLGRIGFFPFLFTANFGQIDGLLDDRTPMMKKYRYIAFLAPVADATTTYRTHINTNFSKKDGFKNADYTYLGIQRSDDPERCYL